MEFRLLGSLELVHDGETRTLSAGGELAVLALLLLNAGRVVPADALIDASWGDRPPANPSNALQIRVSKVRRALQAAGVPGTVVVTRRPGYLVEVDRDQVDAHRFVRLITEARRAADQDVPAARALYDRALGLWRGPALPEFATAAWAAPEVTRLTELRMSAVEERIDIDLAAGRHAEVVSDLEALVTAHPLRERLHGQLIRALYRSGRQGDALAAYRRARQILDDELGVEPSPELRDLEQAILRQDPGLAAPARQASEAGTALPARLNSFVGRTAELGHLRGLLGDHRLVTLTGPGGVGKTSLAVEAARAADDVWLVRLAGVADESQVAAVVAEAVGLRPGPGPAPADQLVAHLRHRPALLLMDNCEHLIDACATLAQRLLEQCDRLRLLTTSREPLGIPGEIQYAVTPLDVPPDDTALAELNAYDAVRLFRDRVAAARPTFQLDGDTAPHVLRICRRLEGIPLALELAAARIKTLPLGELAERLADRFGMLTAGPRTADRRQQTLRATVDWSHQLLSEPERVLFRRLAVFRGGWTLSAAEDVCAAHGIGRTDVYEIMARLVDRSLVIADHGEDARFHMLETLRQYATERLDEAGEAAAVRCAHARHYANALERAEPLLRGPEQGHLLRWLRSERDNVDAATTWCADHAADDPDLALRLVAALGWFWYRASRPDGGQRIAAMVQTAEGGSDGPRARALLAQSVAGRPGSCIVHPYPEGAKAAHQSMALFRQLGDAHRAAYAQTLLAVESVAGPDLTDASVLLDEADARFATEGDQWGRALALFVRMELYFALGSAADATHSAERALHIFRTLDDHWGISAVQYHLGLALHRMGDWSQARIVYQGALADGRRAGLANTVQYALANLGHVEAALGNLQQAEKYFAQAHAVAFQLGADGNPVAALGEGLLARQRGDRDTARRHYATAQHLAGARPDWTAAACSGLASVAEHDGDLDTAETLHLRAYHLADEAGLPQGAATAMEGLARVAIARGEALRAATLLGTAQRRRRTGNSPPTPAERAAINRASEAARAIIGGVAFDRAFVAAPLTSTELSADSGRSASG